MLNCNLNGGCRQIPHGVVRMHRVPEISRHGAVISLTIFFLNYYRNAYPIIEVRMNLSFVPLIYMQLNSDHTPWDQMISANNRHSRISALCALPLVCMSESIRVHVQSRPLDITNKSSMPVPANWTWAEDNHRHTHRYLSDGAKRMHEQYMTRITNTKIIAPPSRVAGSASERETNKQWTTPGSINIIISVACPGRMQCLRVVGGRWMPSRATNIVDEQNQRTRTHTQRETFTCERTHMEWT